MSRRKIGPFELNLLTGELFRDGTPVPLQRTVAALLVELAARPGALVSREQLVERLWPADVNVDYENSLNNAVARLRAQIRRSPIETGSRPGNRLQRCGAQDGPLPG